MSLGPSDEMGVIGFEHHQSSEDGTFQGYFEDWKETPALRGILSHEYTHSWNGKFRRPDDLWTPNFNVPMRDSLLWVYEGQTQYWGYVLAARAGLWTKQEALDAFALTAATYNHHAGHKWRPLQDTTNDPIIADRAPIPWPSWQLSEDYYSVGQLIWLDADTLIRKLSHGKRSLDDFARTFFGVDNGSIVTRTYTFDDVVAALNKVEPYDWAKFFRNRLDDLGPGAPLDGLTRGGYRLIYTAEESPYEISVEKIQRYSDFSFSLGFDVGEGGVLKAVLWDSPAFRAGLTAGTKLVALNGNAYTNAYLKGEIVWARSHKEPLTFIVENNQEFRTATIDYHGGLRYPHLRPISREPRSLDAILAPR